MKSLMISLTMVKYDFFSCFPKCIILLINHANTHVSARVSDSNIPPSHHRLTNEDATTDRKKKNASVMCPGLRSRGIGIATRALRSGDEDATDWATAALYVK